MAGPMESLNVAHAGAILMFLLSPGGLQLARRLLDAEHPEHQM